MERERKEQSNDIRKRQKIDSYQPPFNFFNSAVSHESQQAVSSENFSRISLSSHSVTFAVDFSRRKCLFSRFLRWFPREIRILQTNSPHREKRGNTVGQGLNVAGISQENGQFSRWKHSMSLTISASISQRRRMRLPMKRTRREDAEMIRKQVEVDVFLIYNDWFCVRGNANYLLLTHILPSSCIQDSSYLLNFHKSYFYFCSAAKIDF